MRKQVLSALAFCSALGIAQAQTDVTKEYLVNPSFETLKAADGTTDVAVKQSWKAVCTDGKSLNFWTISLVTIK